jgi:spore coat polysaccharide biosynthesis predicted glycosyltransferase SpsG
VLQALKQINDPELNIKVVLGGSNPHYKEVKRIAELLSGKTEIIVDAQNMPELMMWADLAISAAGSTVLEICFLKLPFIAVVIAENQKQIAHKLNQNKISCLGFYADDVVVNTEKINRVIKKNQIKEVAVANMNDFVPKTQWLKMVLR